VSQEIKKKDERFELRLSSSLLEQAHQKAKEINIPFSRILRRLIEMWLDGKIQLD